MTRTRDPIVEFGELPPDGRGSTSHDDIAAALRARPGQWAKVLTKTNKATAGSTASNIRRGSIRAFAPPGSFEATLRGKDVWARYVGGES